MGRKGVQPPPQIPPPVGRGTQTPPPHMVTPNPQHNPIGLWRLDSRAFGAQPVPPTKIFGKWGVLEDYQTKPQNS